VHAAALTRPEFRNSRTQVIGDIREISPVMGVRWHGHLAEPARRQKATRLLARLLREHQARRRGLADGKEVGNA
jgi:hypothetical protein